MIRTAVAAWRCPDCRGPLERRDDELACPNGHTHPIVRGVPRFVAGVEYVSSFGRQWNRWSQTQLDSQNGTSLFADRFRRYIGPPEELSGLRVCDAGCGAGAFLDVVAPYASEVYGVDLSSAVDAATENMRDHAHVHVAQADIFRLPLEPRSFDFVYCIGVLQHTPDPAAAFSALAELVRPGGRLGVWVYEKRPWEPLKPRHALRLYTTRLRPGRAMRFVEGYAEPALRTRHALKRLPGGRLLSKLVPVADVHDYGGDIPDQLTPEQVREWTVMDTHDMLVTHHDHPQTPRAIRGWFEREGFVDVRRSDAEAVAMVGRRPA